MKNIPFNTQAEQWQRAWREAKKLKLGQNGAQNGVTRDHILPAGDWLLGVWEGIQKPLESYIQTEQIQANTGKHNLKSSWTQCANTFFPFRLNDAMESTLVSFLSRELGLRVAAIDNIDLEYAAPGKLSPQQLLGEDGGKRGSGQTSPDIAIQFTCADRKCGIYLIENKYAEHHFYACSAAKKTIDKAHSERGLEANPDPTRCQNVAKIIANPKSMCHQEAWGRRYWTRLDGCVNAATWNDLPYCPAMRDGYQLLRQQALAQGIADAGLYDFVITGVAYDDRNEQLKHCLVNIGIDNFKTGWGRLFKNGSGVTFHCFTHQKLVEWVARSRNRFVQNWATYLRERYGF